MENGDTFAVPHLVLRDAWGNAPTMEAHQQVVFFHFALECVGMSGSAVPKPQVYEYTLEGIPKKKSKIHFKKIAGDLTFTCRVKSSLSPHPQPADAQVTCLPIEISPYLCNE